MPTIAEIIAAKKAATKGGSVSKAQEDREMEEVIDRIDPPKKHKALVLSASTPLPPADVAKKAHYKELRSLSRSHGEAIPMVPVDADKSTQTWHEAMNSFETDLCLMRDPTDPEVAWLAVRSNQNDCHPILIHRLPWILWEHPQTSKPESEPY